MCSLNISPPRPLLLYSILAFTSPWGGCLMVTRPFMLRFIKLLLFKCSLIKRAADSHSHLLHPSSIFLPAHDRSISLNLILVLLWYMEPRIRSLSLCDCYLSECAASAGQWWTSRNRINIAAVQQCDSSMMLLVSTYFIHLYMVSVKLLNDHLCIEENQYDFFILLHFPLSSVVSISIIGVWVMVLVENGKPREASLFSLLSSKVVFHTGKQAKSSVLHNLLELEENQQQENHSKVLGDHAITKSISKRPFFSSLPPYVPCLQQMHL